jgi:hypothetical protein
MFESNYSSCTCNSENICNAGVQGKKKDKVKSSLPQKLMVFGVSSPFEY